MVSSAPNKLYIFIGYVVYIYFDQIRIYIAIGESSAAAVVGSPNPFRPSIRRRRRRFSLSLLEMLTFSLNHLSRLWFFPFNCLYANKLRAAVGFICASVSSSFFFPSSYDCDEFKKRLCFDTTTTGVICIYISIYITWFNYIFYRENISFLVLSFFVLGWKGVDSAGDNPKTNPRLKFI